MNRASKLCSSKKFDTGFLVGMMIMVQLLIHGPDFFHALKTYGRWYTGQASWFDPWDINVYISAINYGMRGKILLQNVYDTPSKEQVLIYPLYTLVGSLFGFTHMPAYFLFHVVAVITTSILLLVIWNFTSSCTAQSSQRRFAFVFICMGGGLSWVFRGLLLGADMTHANVTMHGAFRSPHEAVSLIFFLLLMSILHHQLISKRPINWIAFIAALAFVLLHHPYMLAVVLVIWVGLGIFFRQLYTSRSWKLLGFGILGALVAYYLLIGQHLLRSITFYGVFHQQHVMVKPLEVVAGFGVLLPLAIMNYKHRRNQTVQFLLIWFVFQFGMTFLPLYNRLFFRGLWIPLSLLASYPIFLEKSPYALVRQPLMRVTALGLSIGTTLMIFYYRLDTLQKSPWVTRSSDEGQIYSQLSQSGLVDDMVLAAFPTSSLVPTVSNKRAYAGHMVQSPDHKIKLADTVALLQGNLSENEARNFLLRNNIRWIIWGSEEKSIAQSNTFPYSTIAQPIVQRPTAILYRVVSDNTQ